MPRVKQFNLDNEGRATEILWDNGKTEKIPFYVSLSLGDFGDDKENYWDWMNSKVEEYGEIASRLRPGEPNEMQFNNLEDLERAKDDWKDTQAEERMSRAMGKALYARDEAVRPTPEVDWDFLARIQSPHVEDRERAKNRLATNDVIQHLRAKAQRAEKAGDFKKARELIEMANYQELPDSKDKGEYIFQTEYSEQIASDAESKLNEIKGKWIEGNPNEAQGFCRRANHERKKIESSWDVRVNEDGTKFMVVDLEHAGLTGRHVSDMAEGEQRLQSLMQLQYPEAKEGEEKKVETQADPNDPFSVYENPQKAFEAFRVSGTMPKEGLKPVEESQSADWEESLKNYPVK